MRLPKTMCRSALLAWSLLTIMILGACEAAKPFAPATQAPATQTVVAPAGATATSPSVSQTPTASSQLGVPVQNQTLKTIPELVKALKPSVVHVQTEAVQLDFFNRPVPSGGVGTGEILDKNGHILTNNHVVEGATKIVVTLADGRTLPAKLIGRDASTDLAVIKIEADNLTPITIGRSGDLQVGEFVVAIGHALDLPGGPTVTGGLVSALERSIDVSANVTIQHLIQTDAPINPGNSGGPLLNMYGQMVGINTAKVSVGEGIGFAIAVDSAMPFVKQLMDTGKVLRGYLGISVADVSEAMALQNNLPVKAGVYIIRTEAGGPAAKAGLRADDIIVSLAGAKVSRFADMDGVLLNNRAGATVAVEYYRGTDKRTGSVVLGERPA